HARDEQRPAEDVQQQVAAIAVRCRVLFPLPSDEAHGAPDETDAWSRATVAPVTPMRGPGCAMLRRRVQGVDGGDPRKPEESFVARSVLSRAAMRLMRVTLLAIAAMAGLVGCGSAGDHGPRATGGSDSEVGPGADASPLDGVATLDGGADAEAGDDG